jgi:hypothetical protein
MQSTIVTMYLNAKILIRTSKRQRVGDSSNREKVYICVRGMDESGYYGVRGPVRAVKDITALISIRGGRAGGGVGGGWGVRTDSHHSQGGEGGGGGVGGQYD